MSYEKLLHRQRVFFGSGEMMDYSYRMNALTALREALVYYEAGICQALVDDLNKSPYETFISEYGLVLRQITHVEHRLKGWMKPRSKAAGITGLPGKAYELVDEKVIDQFCGEFAAQCQKMAGDAPTNPRYPRIISPMGTK